MPLGYDAGPADGVAGLRTQRALSLYQRDNGLPETSALELGTIELLLAETGSEIVTACPSSGNLGRLS
jgi:peptidoglycan hydrolase-like protein with peptidoglycan-binding domain